MDTEIKIVRGPSSTRLSKEAAATELEKLPGFPKEATYSIEEVDGRWVAAVIVPKVAAPFPPKDDEPAPSGDSSGPPFDEGDKGDDVPSEKKDDGDDEPSSDGPPKQDGKMSVEHQLAQLTDMLTKITDALGLSDPSGMVPGMDDGSVPPPGPPGAGGPPVPPGKPGVDAQGKQHVIHERSLKPGEAPPGTTPVGAPSFASVQVEEDHPWKDAIEAGVKEFEVESPIGDERLSAVADELKMLASPYGYTVTDLAPHGEGTSRTASARIVRTR